MVKKSNIVNKSLNFIFIFIQATVRQLTTAYAQVLSGVIQNVTETHTYKNFDMLYTELPIAESKFNFF